MIWILRMKMNQASCAGEAYAGFGFGTGIKRRPASQVQSPTTDETVLIEDLIDALPREGTHDRRVEATPARRM
jgi:hypothetical protein